VLVVAVAIHAVLAAAGEDPTRWQRA
jgi:hypothetical protein